MHQATTVAAVLDAGGKLVMEANRQLWRDFLVQAEELEGSPTSEFAALEDTLALPRNT